MACCAWGWPPDHQQCDQRQQDLCSNIRTLSVFFWTWSSWFSGSLCNDCHFHYHCCRYHRPLSIILGLPLSSLMHTRVKDGYPSFSSWLSTSTFITPITIINNIVSTTTMMINDYHTGSRTIKISLPHWPEKVLASAIRFFGVSRDGSRSCFVMIVFLFAINFIFMLRRRLISMIMIIFIFMSRRRKLREICWKIPPELCHWSSQSPDIIICYLILRNRENGIL